MDGGGSEGGKKDYKAVERKNEATSRGGLHSEGFK